MPYETIPIDQIQVQPGYNDLVRSPKEVHANALEVAEFMQQAKDAREMFPIRYVVAPDGTKYTRNHATLEAAQMRKWDTVCAVESPNAFGSTEDYLDLLISNNQGHPLDRRAQGQLYKSLRDGIKAEDWTEEDPKWIKEPMTEKEIGEASAPTDYTTQHVKDCITLAESSPEIQELMEQDLVSANIVITAKQWAEGNDAKQLKILKHAIREADGARATKKHMDAIKHEYKKLKAVPTQEPVGDPAHAANNRSKTRESQNEHEPQEEENSEEAENLFKQTESDLLEEGSKKNDKLKSMLKTVLVECSDEYAWAASDDDIDGAAEKLIAALSKAREVF